MLDNTPQDLDDRLENLRLSRYKSRILNEGYGKVWKPILRSKRISAGAKALYAYIDSFAGSENKPVWVSQETMAEELGISVRQLRRLVQELAEQELIEVKRRGNTQTNLYQIQDIPQVFWDEWDALKNQRKKETMAKLGEIVDKSSAIGQN